MTAMAIAGRLRIECGGANGVRIRDEGEDLRDGRSRERRRSHDHLVEHDAERPDVAAGIGRVATRMLRTHVPDRPARRRAFARGAGQRRDPEVEQLHETIARDEDVLRLHIAVHEPRLVRRRQTRGHLACDLERVARKERATGESVAERLAFIPRHRDEAVAVCPSFRSGRSSRRWDGRAPTRPALPRRVVRRPRDPRSRRRAAA